MKLKRITIALSIFIVAIIGFVISFYFYNLTSVSKDNTSKIVVIEPGTVASIGKTLKDNNLIRNEFVFKLYIKLYNKNNLKASTYKFSESMSLKEIVTILEEGNSYNPDEISITFKEGRNMRWIANIVSENTNNTEEDFIAKVNDEEYIDTLIKKYWFLSDDIKNSKIYYDLEGYLFPDTYFFYNKDVSVETIIETMLDETKKKLAPYKKQIKKLDLSIHEFFTLASMIELEGAKADDRKAVSGVFYNRLADKWVLGSDVTTYYALKIDDFNVKLTEEIGLYKCDNAYNTRCKSYVGLPVGPICNPGMESILATLEPNIQDYYWFVADCKGKTYLNVDEKGHYNTIAKLERENNWCG